MFTLPTLQNSKVLPPAAFQQIKVWLISALGQLYLSGHSACHWYINPEIPESETLLQRCDYINVCLIDIYFARKHVNARQYWNDNRNKYAVSGAKILLFERQERLWRIFQFLRLNRTKNT